VTADSDKECSLLGIYTIDVRTEKIVGELRGDIGAIKQVLGPSSKKKKRTVQPGDAFEDTAF
jgi:hypothetical protein